MKKNVSGLPDINRRIKELIDKHTNGNVRSFCVNMGLNESSKVNRLFNKDKRSDEYPIPSTEIIIMIANAYNVSTDWLLLGKEKTNENSHINNIDISTRDITGDNNTVVGDCNSGTTMSNSDYIELFKEQQMQMTELLKYVLNGKET